MVPAHAMSIQLRCVTQGALASFSLQYIDRQAQPKLKTKRGGRGGRPPRKLFSHERPWFLLCLIRATLAERSYVKPCPEISLFTFGHFMCQLCHYIPFNSFTCGHLCFNCFVLVPIISFIQMCRHVSIVSLSAHRFVHTRMCHVSSTFNRCPLFHSHMPIHLLSKFTSLGPPCFIDT